MVFLPVNGGGYRVSSFDGTLRIVIAVVLRSSQFLGEADEKPFRPADIAEPIRVLILDDFADELRAAIAEPCKSLVEIVHGEHDAEVAERVDRGVAVICDDGRPEEAG
jgi:hypothetical protein